MDRINKLKEYLLASPDDNFLLHALALEHIKQGEDGLACEIFESILKRDPAYIGSYYHLAKLHERNGRTEDAKKVYEKGIHESDKAGDKHANAELKSAYEELIF
jgi:Tfp pilus assembly protein PilF